MVAYPDELGQRESAPLGSPATTQIPNGILHGVRCPYCHGNIYGDELELTCMMCSRIWRLVATGAVVQARMVWQPAIIRRVGDGESQRTARGVSESQGTTGLAARILAAVPEAPHHMTAWALGRPIRLSTEAVRAILMELVDLGLVLEVRYQAGCVQKRTSLGYQRPRLGG